MKRKRPTLQTSTGYSDVKEDNTTAKGSQKIESITVEQFLPITLIDVCMEDGCDHDSYFLEKGKGEGEGHSDGVLHSGICQNL